MRQGGLKREEHPREVGAQHGFEIRGLGLAERRMGDDAGVGEHDVQPAQGDGRLAIRRSVASTSATSARKANAASPSSARAASSVDWLRPVIATRAPSATNSLAVAKPMPLLPPVIRAALFARRIGQTPVA